MLIMEPVEGCVYVCVCVCVHLYLYICTYRYIYAYMYMYICMYSDYCTFRSLVVVPGSCIKVFFNYMLLYLTPAHCKKQKDNLLWVYERI